MSDGTHCIACGGADLRTIFRKEGRSYLRCTACRLVTIDPMPAVAELQAYYHRDYERDDGMGTTRAQAKRVMRASARRRLERLKDLAPGPRWLEVGAGSGAFLVEASAAGYRIEGLDLSTSAVELLRRRGLRAHATSIEDFAATEPYDLVVGFDVIEHVREPIAFLRAAHRLLRPGGLLVLATPDTRSLICRLMRHRWYHYIPETHLFHFDRHNLSTMLSRLGFHVVLTEPAYKSVSFAYSLVQFEAYNPWIHAILKPAARLLPRAVLDRPLYINIGEFTIVAERPASTEDASRQRQGVMRSAFPPA
jgi:2-polyprenyl-3-methyl-5-hydroxy-6-metoxy-1,4-benzoquinol methylase